MTEINDTQAQDFIALLTSIISIEPDLALYYFVRYPVMLSKMQKKIKIIESIDLAKAVLEIVVLVYPVLKLKSKNVEWIIHMIENTLLHFCKEAEIRQAFCQFLKKFEQFAIPSWINDIEPADEISLEEENIGTIDEGMMNKEENFGNMGGGLGGFGMEGGMYDGLDE